VNSSSLKNKLILILALSVLLPCVAFGIGGGDGNPQLKTPEKSLKAFRDLRVGLFIHWNPCSQTGLEISWCRGASRGVPKEQYDNLYKTFRAEKFDAREWVTLFKESGFKYIVYATKHHDGFAMWATKTTDYNVMNSPLGRDVVGELARACKKQGVVFCPYYSILDWYQPDYTPYGPDGPGYGLPAGQKPDFDKYVKYMNEQLKELTRKYGPFRAWWFDGGWEGSSFTHQRGTELYAYMRRLQSDVLVNNRVDTHLYNGKYSIPWFASESKSAGDYSTPEGGIGPFTRDIPWESCVPAGSRWSWCTNDQNLRPSKQYISDIVNCASRDGNLIFGIGPMPDGRINPRVADILREVGVWLKQYGESIYATRGGPLKPNSWYGSTCRGNNVYLHVFKTVKGTLVLPPLPQRIVTSRLMNGGAVAVKQTDKDITVTIDENDLQATDTIVVLALDASAERIQPVEGESLLASSKAHASNVRQNKDQFSADRTIDGDPSTYWTTDEGVKESWIEYDLGTPRSFSRATLLEGNDYEYIRHVEIQVKEDDKWTSVHHVKVGEGIPGYDQSFWDQFALSQFTPQGEMNFKPVTARFVRLNIVRAVKSPVVREFKLYER
jgi:alpha-L-fucosidase